MENFSFKRFLSLVMAFVMVLSYVPANAFATEGTPSDIVAEEPVVEEPEVEEPEVEEPVVEEPVVEEPEVEEPVVEEPEVEEPEVEEPEVEEPEVEEPVEEEPEEEETEEEPEEEPEVEEPEEDELVVKVQAMIDALRTTINAGEEAEAYAEYEAVTAAITALTEEQRAQLDLTNYYAAAVPTVIPAGDPVAKVGNTEYGSIGEAIANWTNNSTLTLMADVTLPDVVTLKSTEHHILDLGTYTMTAASGKNAFVIQACGTGDAERTAITIRAAKDENGEEYLGTIDAGSKCVVYYKYADGGISGNDRPIIKIEGGKFDGSTSSWGTAGIYTIGTAARKCATLNISGGTFNCSINGSGKSKLLISGGTFNYSVGSQGDSTALRLISGGKFKTLGFMTADSNNTKFWFGTSMGNSNVGLYVDADGYLVVGGPVITEVSAEYPAVASNATKWSSYLKYSAAGTYGLYYEDAEMAIDKHGAANVTIYEEPEKPAIEVDEDLAKDETLKDIVDVIQNSEAVKDYTPDNVPDGAELVIKLIAVDQTNDSTPATITYDVAPMANGVEVKPTEAITFRLPVPAAFAGTHAKVYHDSELMGIYEIKGEGDARYVEISSADFSVYAVEPFAPVAKVGNDVYTDIQEAIKAAAPSGTVTLLSDVTVDKWIMFSETLTIGDGTLITLEMNGLTIDGNGKTLTIKDVESAGNGGHIFYDGDYNVHDLTINMGANVNGLGITSGKIENVTFTGGLGTSSGAAIHVSDGLIASVHAGNVTIEGCTFENNGGAIYFETAQDGLVVNNNTFKVPAAANVILLRGTEQFTNNTVVSGRTVNVVSGSPVVTGNNFGDVRLKVYNEATATISGNTINNLVFNDANAEAKSTFADDNNLSDDAKAALEAVTPKYVAKVGDVEYKTLEEAFAAAAEGETITLLEAATPALKSQRAITKAAVIDLGGKTLTLTEDDLYFGTTTFKNGTIVVDPSVKPSTAVFWMFKNQTLTFDAVKIVATGVTGTYLIGLEGENSDLNLLNGSEIVVENTTALDLDIICVNGSTNNDIVINNSKVNVTNLDGRVFFRGNYTVSGNSEIELEGITKAGFRIEAGQTLTIADTATVDIVGDPRDGGIHLTDATATYTKEDTATVNATVNRPKVAQIGETPYTTLAEAAAAAQAGNEIVMLADVTEDVTLPAGVTFNGNGKQVGVITAAGEVTFKGHTKATSFGVQYVNTTINIVEGACLEITGTGRLVIGHGCTFNITGTIENAKTANVADLTPSLIMPGASFTGAGVTFNATNAYIKVPSSYSSTSKNASGTFDFNITNSIWESADKLAFEAQSTAATVNFELKDSVLTTGSHLVFGVSKGEVVIDNSNVNVGTSRQLENRSTMTIKNGSVVNGVVATSSNAKNPGTIIVENATYAVTGEFSGSDLGTGTIIVKSDAIVSASSITKANIKIDATGMNAGDEINLTANLSKLAGKLEVINNDKLEAKIVDGKIVLAEKPVAKIGETSYASLEEAFKAATSGCTIDILSDVTVDTKWDARNTGSKFTVPVTINGNGKTIKFTGTVNDNNWNAIFRFEENATVKNLTIDISEATGAQRVITAKKSLTVDGLTIIGSARYGVIFGEGSSAADLAAADIVVKNSTLTGTRRAISDNEGGKDVKSVAITGNTLNANVYISASESITFNNNTANGEVDLRSYAADNVLSVEAQGNTLTAGVKNYIYAKTIDAQEEFNAENPPVKVSTKAELNAAIAAAKDGDVITLTADIDYGTDQLKIEKAITLDLGGKTLTTRNAYGGMSVKNNATVKNGTIVHASNTAAIKVWNATAFEDLVIDVQGKGDANKTIGGIVLQSGSTTRVDSIKNVTIKGEALTNGIETYNCGDATENVIGSMENVTIDAKSTGMLISAPCGTATNCNITGGTNGIEIWIKGNYSASLELADTTVNGGVFAHDEFNSNPATVNNGTLSLTTKGETNVKAEDITLTIARAEEKVDGILKTVIDNAQAKVNDTYYKTFNDAMAAAKAGDTITLCADITLNAPITVTKNLTIDGGNYTLTYTGTDRAIDIPNTANGADVTIKNLTINAANANRGINYNTNGSLTVEKVTVTIGADVDGYAINFPSSADGAKVSIIGSTLSSRNPVNIWGENMEITINDSAITSVDNSETYWYSAIQLNNDNNGNAAEGTKVTVTGGSITAKDEDGEPSFAVTNWTNTGSVSISDTTTVTGTIEEVIAWIAGVGFTDLQDAFDTVIAKGYTGDLKIVRDIALSETVKVPAAVAAKARTTASGITLNLNGKTITGTDNATSSFALIEIQPDAELTITGEGKITLTATNNRGWSAYSSVISNQRGTLTVNGGTIEHLGGTDMAYGIDILTNTGAQNATAIINGGTIKSTYRAIRQFLNSTVATNSLTVNGGTIEGGSKSIWMQGANAGANPGALTVGKDATLKGDVYLSGTAGATEYPVELSVAAGALSAGSQVSLAATVPAGYVLEKNEDGDYGIRKANYVAEANGTQYESLQAAVNAGGTVTLLKDITEDVNITKNVTIDGANFKYTGTLNIGTVENVTIQNVNFVKGRIDGNTSAKGRKLTVKNCTFDGVDKSINYAITVRHGDSVVIENSTAKNYKTGMLYIPQSVTAITVKDVTVENVAAAFNISYSGDALFEEVAFENVTYGIHFQIYGPRTYTVKNCDLSGATNPFWFWDIEGVDAKVTVVFEGNNIVPKFQEKSYTTSGILKLAEGATLTAPEGITVTTDVDKMKVEYENGTYKLAKAVVAKIGNVEYPSLQAAVDAAKAGATIKLICDAEGPGVIIDKNLTIDFTGFTYTLTEGVGSTGTESNGFQILKGNTVMLRNGTLKVADSAADKFYILIQNYASLTVNSMTLDGTNLDKWSKTDGDSYVVSNNSGTFNANSATKLIVNNDGEKAFAIDACDKSSWGYELPVVTVSATKNIYTDNDTKAEKPYQYIEAAAYSGNKYYATLQQAVNQGGTITMFRDVTGAGVVINKNVNINFGGFAYTLTEGVGSTGTESNGIQILKGNTVVLRNGTLKVADSAADKFYILVQNYAADLSMSSMTLDGTNLDKWSKTDGDSYVLSNNSGNVSIGTGTKIIANNDGDKAFAFDVCDQTAKGYELPVVTVNKTATINGNIEAAAKIGNVYYATMQAAIDAAGNGKVITLMKDINLANETPVLLDNSYNTYFKVEGKSITIDLNGKTISGAYTDTSKMLVGVFSTENNGHLTLTGNGTVNLVEGEGATVYALISNYNEDSSITIVNGTYTVDSVYDALMHSSCDEGLIVKGGTFTLGNVGKGHWSKNRGNGSPWIFNVNGQNAGAALVSGGTYNFNVGKQHWAHEVDIVDAKGNLGIIKDNGDGTWTVTGETAEAAIMTDVEGDYDYPIGYATLADALAAAKAGQAVLLMKDVTLEKSVAIAGNRNVVIDLNGHTLSSAKAHVVTCYYNKTTITIKDSVGGGKVLTTGSGKHAFVVQSNLVIDGAEISSVKGGNAIVAQTNNANVTIQNDAVINGKVVVKAGKLTVTGGTFNDKLEITDGVTVEISGGYFKYPVNAEWCAEGYIPTDKLDDGYYSVKQDPTIGKVAQISETYYETLAEAIASAKSGDTVTLLADIEETTNNTVTNSGGYATIYNIAEKAITIDLNGKKISVNANPADLVNAKKMMLMGVFTTDTNGALTLKNGSVEVKANDAIVYALATAYGEGSKLVINSGSYTADVVNSSLIYSQHDEIVTINGGTFNLGNVGKGPDGNGSPWIFNAKGQNTANIIVNGGSFNADIQHQYYPFEVQMPETLALKNENGMYKVVSAVAYVTEREWSSQWYTNNVGYATLEEAIAACEGPKTRSGKTSEQEEIVLLQNIKLDKDPVFGKDDVLNKNGYTITVGDDKVVVTGGDDLKAAAASGQEVILAKPEIEVKESITVAENKELLINSTTEINFQGNGTTITTNGTGTAAGESYDYGYVGFIPANGEDATVENVTVTGSGFVEVGHHLTSTGGSYTIDKLNVQNLVATLAVNNGGNNIAAAFSHYGNAVMTNCVMTGTTTEKEGFKPYDAAFVNGTTTELNACTFDNVYVANQAKVTVSAGTTIDVLDSYAISTKGLGKVVIGKDARIGTINLYDTRSYKATLLIEEGARVGVINYNGVAYTMQEWMKIQ